MSVSDRDGRGARTEQPARTIPLALALLVLAGIALRVALAIVYDPAYAHSYDSLLYVNSAAGELFGDTTRTVGYPLFLRALHWVSTDLALTIQAQHVLGVATGVLLYATVRSIGAPVWAALIAAAAVLLSLDQIFLEHILMAEAPYTFLLVLAVYAAVRTLDEPALGERVVNSRHGWIALAAASLTLAAWLRPVTVPIAVFLAIWVALAIPGERRRRVAHAGVAAAVAAVVVGSYFALSAAHGGAFGFGTSSGWALYSRAAPFADCNRFDPPAGSEGLCETTPADSRDGPDFYGWQPDSPARRIYGGPPAGDEELGAFARAAIWNQPLSYAKVLGRDLVRYFHPAFALQDFSGLGYDEVDVAARQPGIEEEILASINAYYDDERLGVRGGASTLGQVQDVVRVQPKLMLLALVLAAVGIALSSGRVRWSLVLLLGVFAISLIVPPATSIWSARYAIPVGGVIAAAGAIGLWVIVARLREARPQTGSRDSDSPIRCP